VPFFDFLNAPPQVFLIAFDFAFEPSRLHIHNPLE
jgi:hypothetical protein